MALLKSCFCCSLLQGSIITGVYTSVVYLAAFIMELCFVLEGENWVNSGRHLGPLPLPAYILVVLHFTVVGLSIIMLYALYQRRIGVLLAWVFILSLLFFPELGIVLFLVIFHWGLPNLYGVIEIAFYLVRAPVNVMCILCVHSLHSLWKDELATERSLKKLSTLQMIKDSAGRTSSYKNAAYLGSTTDITSLRSMPISNHGNIAPPTNFGMTQNGTVSRIPASVSNFDMQNGAGVARRYSTASQYSDFPGNAYQKGVLPANPLPSYRFNFPGSWDPLYVENRFPIPDSRSEFNASLFPIHRSMEAIPVLSHSRSEQTIFHSPKSPHDNNGYGMNPMMAPGMGRFTINPGYTPPSYDYYDFGTMSRSLLDPEYSIAYRQSMVQADFSTQSLDRRRYLRRTQSFTTDPYATQQGMRSLPHVYYGYPNQESKSSLGAESDDFRRYRDVAL